MPSAKTGYQFDFIDVTKGTNFDQGVLGYSALPGFDQVSGIGMPLGTQITTDECGTRQNTRLLSNHSSELSEEGPLQ